MFPSLLWLLLAAGAIYLACEWFVNAIEWLGSRLNLGSTAVGSVLAASGTALPESVVTFVAVVLGGSEEADQVGIGAAMGGPLVLSTLGYAVIGVVLAMSTRQWGRPVAGIGAVRGDQLAFLPIFAVKLGLGLVLFAVKPWMAIGFVLAYVWYVRHEIKQSAGQDRHGADGLDPLKLQPRRVTPSSTAIWGQTIAALVVIFVSSEIFVDQLQVVGPELGLPPATVALLLAPIATELPEIVNAVIWTRQGKPQLALANIAGSMMIQSTIPSALGIAFTPWKLDATMVMAGVVTMAAVLCVLWLGRRRRISAAGLATGGLGYLFALGWVLVA